MALQIVVLAAGQGKRMVSTLPKVLHRLAGKPLLEHVLTTAAELGSAREPIVIYGHQGERLRESLPSTKVRWVEQKQQLGTGDALKHALPFIDPEDQVLILYGDVPLISAQTLMRLMSETPKKGMGLVTATLHYPKGYGRIKRDKQKRVTAVVEEKDATTRELAIQEVNSGIYVVPASYLKKWLPQLKNNNAQKEFYLTDIIPAAVKGKIRIHTVQPTNAQEILGVNDREQLAYLEKYHQLLTAEKWMQQGVTLMDATRFDVRGEVHIGRDTTIDINVILEGRVVIGEGCVIGANCVLRNTTVGDGVEIKPFSYLDGAEVDHHCLVGPYARLRPGAVLAAQVHIGNFVEIKNSRIGEGTKINHLSYVGDSEVGKRVNIGAGTITCNYDGVNKHKTIIGDRVQVGSDSTLVAPVTIHDDAYVAAATTIRNDVPSGALVYNKREECIREGWAFKKVKQKE